MLPNLVTGARIVIGPFFAYFFIKGNSGHVAWLWMSFAALLLIELSDALDGFIARRTGQVTDFGKFFDPMADSLSRLTIFSSFLVAGIIPLWMFLIFLYRDTFVAGIRYLCVKEAVIVPARISGKLKAVFQAIGSFAVLGISFAHAYNLSFFPKTIAGMHPGFVAMLFPTLVTIYSLYDYWDGNRSVLRFGQWGQA